MPETDIGSAVASDLTNAMSDFGVNAQQTDAAGDQKEFTWQSTTWTTNLGYYKTIPELKVSVDTKVTWIIGAGIETDEQTEMLLMTITGNGKDSFTGILKNQSKVAIIDGDSYAEIIRNKEILANLKPLAPDSIVSVWNSKGRIKRYEQVNKRRILMGFLPWFGHKRFKPNQIFHLSRERIADEVHGIGVIESVKKIIDARNEAMDDWRIVMHRNVFPRWQFELDTDDPAEVTAFKKKQDAANAGGENMYIPKGAVVATQVVTVSNNALNPLVWIDRLNDYFYQAVNVPQIIIGNAKEFTDASGKIVYLAFEQSIKAAQLYLEEQVLAQLNLEINLTFPASLQNDAVSNTPTETTTVEEEPIEEAAQPNDVNETLPGKT